MEVFLNVWYWTVFVVFLLEPTTALQRYYMEDGCDSTIDMAEEEIAAGRLSVTKRWKYRSRLQCHVTIMAPKDMRLTIVFSDLAIEWEDICDDDFVQLFDGTSIEAPMVQGLDERICGHRIPPGGYVTTGEALTIFFQSDVAKQDNGFDLVITAFHINDPCRPNEFKCDNGHCIASSLECNNFDNCGDDTDDCKVSAEVMMGIILSVFLLTVVGVGVITIYKKKKKRHRSRKSKRELKMVHRQLTSTKTTDTKTTGTCGCGIKLPLKSQNSTPPRMPIRKWQPQLGDNWTATDVWATNVAASAPYQTAQGVNEESKEVVPKKAASI